jgi:hypothetical protein
MTLRLPRFPAFRAGLRAFRRHRIPLLVVYLLWASLFFGVEGVARYSCRVPGQDWIEEGEDGQEQLERNALYNQGMRCLKATRWYSEAMEILPTAAWAWAFLAVAAYLTRVVRKDGVFGSLYHDGFVYAAVFTGTLTLAYLPYLASTWLFQHYGFAAP